MKRSLLFLCILYFFSITIAFSQNYQIEGKIRDSKSKHPLAFVNIVINDGLYGGTSDIDGNFSLKFHQEIKTLTLSYVGYQTQVYQVNPQNTKKTNIELVRSSVELNEVQIFPGENPAHRIIDLVIENRKNNDPKKMKSFSYTSYDKMIFTVDVDSLKDVDTTLLSKSEKNTVDFFENKDLFIMETVSDRKFLYPNRNYDNVICNKSFWL